MKRQFHDDRINTIPERKTMENLNTQLPPASEAATDIQEANAPIPTQDAQTVDTESKPIRKLIDGVVIRPLITHPDERGTLTELYREAWGVHPDPLVYVKLITARPGMIKGWVKHMKQDDRMALCFGTALYVLYDDRPESPTYGMVNELCFSDHNRSLFTIPAGVYHAIKNVGITDVVMINMPNNLYNHAAPDKYRLPLDTDVIPYEWRTQGH
jgi:dTDP-4-dehydrorhamnose 3,5-epimerase